MKWTRNWIVFCALLGCILHSRDCTASKKYNRYLAHIFNKYGSGGTMSFEGLEHLMHNLGLGGLEFNPTHTIEEHHPDGYKIPDLVLYDDDMTADNNLEKAKYGNGRMEVKELEVNKSDGRVEQDLNDLSDLNEENILSAEGNKQNFKEMHDPKHRHPRHHADPESGNKCLSPKSLMKLVMDPDDLQNKRKFNYRTSFQQNRSKRYVHTTATDHDEDEEYTEVLSFLKITPVVFMKLCPALLVQIDQDACAKPIEVESNLSPEGYSNAWIYASVSILIISCCGLFGVAIVPLAKSVAYHEILKFLVAVAVGTLCGDALMHLLPHAMSSGHGEREEDDQNSGHHSNEPVWLCSCAFMTCLFMYSLETLLPLIRGSSGHHHGHSHHSHSHSANPDDTTNMDMEVGAKHQTSVAKELNVMLDEDKLDKKGVELSPVAFMVILGDGLHNITDGLAIGAAFAGDPVTGMATALAVLCHELPHELGDFALLLQTGVNIKRAMFLNIVSSVLSFIGMAGGLLVTGMHSNMVKWIYASTAGSFLYIALSDLIPEMNRSGKQDVKNCLIQITGIFLGGAIMMAIALNEDSLRFLFE